MVACKLILIFTIYLVYLESRVLQFTYTFKKLDKKKPQAFGLWFFLCNFFCIKKTEAIAPVSGLVFCSAVVSLTARCPSWAGASHSRAACESIFRRSKKRQTQERRALRKSHMLRDPRRTLFYCATAPDTPLCRCTWGDADTMGT